jgi:DNA helicase-2/ATP-dependent DNA helicase PcrA
MSHWVEHLNPEQCEAALHNHGPMLILAGAGSGKTTVLVSRTGRLIEEGICRAKEICVLTFTNKAAKELQHRVTKKLGKKLSKGLWAGTFHSFGLHVLRQYHKEARLPKNFGILSTGDQASIVKELLKDFSTGKESYDADLLISMMSDWRSIGRTRAKLDDEYEVACEWLLPKYIKRLEHLGLVDFDELLLGPVRLAENFPDIAYDLKNRFKQLMVDEFQDTNKIQMKLVLLLSAGNLNISVVGDDDQSIYGWRGAEVSNILSFPHLFDECKVVRLERNYRSTPAILDVANVVIQKNTERHDKVLRAGTNSGPGEKPELFVYENEDEEAERVCSEILQLNRDGKEFSDIAILYRSNSQGALIEAELRKNMIPYKLNGGTAFFDRRETKDILAYLRCALNPNELALRRIINTPHRGIGESSLDKIIELSREKSWSFERSARNWKQAEVNEKTGASLDDFFLLLDDFVPIILKENGKSCGQNLQELMHKIGYKSFIEKLSKDHKAASMRWALVDIFANVLDSFIEQGGRKPQTIIEFIDAMELRDQMVEGDEKSDEPKVQLMTFHASKGLEFPVCFMVGIEEDLIPHKSLGGDISEERRLFYVAVTRAKEKLIMSRARERRKYGRMKKSAPSRFLLEVPEDMLKKYDMGFRPINVAERKSMLDDLYAKLDKNKEKQNLD